MKPVKILDCTARDGSYLIDYQFTAEDTYLICTGLQRAGCKLIEVGHGSGMRSSTAGKGVAAESDEKYLEAAQASLADTDALFGMFFIPGIGKRSDLDTASRYGMGFVRIGTNVTEVSQARKYIEHARALGMTVASNLMKSYAVSTAEFIKSARRADRFGADIVTVVDSAGGMFPADVKRYISRLKENTDKQVGFHGHNNLQLGIANTLEAVYCGADVVDASLQGMGRSAGNTQTEILVLALEKEGYHTGIDPYLTLDIGERIVKPMMNRPQGVDDISIVSGIAQFHSSFNALIDKHAGQHAIDPRRLIMEVSKIDRVNVTDHLVAATADRLRQSLVDTTRSRLPGHRLPGFADLAFKSPSDEATAIDAMVTRSKKTGKKTAFSMTLSRTGASNFPFIRSNASSVIGNCEAGNLPELERIALAVDGRADWLLLDESCPELRSYFDPARIRRSRFAWYSEARALRLSICTLLSQKAPIGRVVIFSDLDNGILIRHSLQQHGIKAFLWSGAEGHDNTDGQKDLENVLKRADALIALDQRYTDCLQTWEPGDLQKSLVIYAARPHAYPKRFWQAALNRGLEAIRVDTRSGLAAEIDLVIETCLLLDTMGGTLIAGVPVVSGGTIGPRGTVVVDAINSPTQVIGVADGYGGLLSDTDPADNRNIAAVRDSIFEDRLTKSFS